LLASTGSANLIMMRSVFSPCAENLGLRRVTEGGSA